MGLGRLPNSGASAFWPRTSTQEGVTAAGDTEEGSKSANGMGGAAVAEMQVAL